MPNDDWSSLRLRLTGEGADGAVTATAAVEEDASTAVAAPPGGADVDGVPVDGTALRRRALEAAMTAYSATHGHPLDREPPGGARWGTSARVAVVAAALLMGITAVVVLRALASPTVEVPVAVSTPPLVDDRPVAVVADPGGAPGGSATDAPGAVPDAGGVDGAGAVGSATEVVVVVHVVGEVVSPGIVRLTPGARVVDAVEAAGGPLPSAELGAVNLARPVVDGEQVHVPRPGEEPRPVPVPDGGAPGGTAGGLVDVNRAGAGELETLPGVGPVLAQRIVDHRTTHGPFSAVDELAAVSGIGPKVLAGLRDRVTAG